MNKRMYSLVCVAVTDTNGNKIRGCGRGWTGELPETTCSLCGGRVEIWGTWIEKPLCARVLRTSLEPKR